MKKKLLFSVFIFYIPILFFIKTKRSLNSVSFAKLVDVHQNDILQSTIYHNSVAEKKESYKQKIQINNNKDNEFEKEKLPQIGKNNLLLKYKYNIEVKKKHPNFINQDEGNFKRKIQSAINNRNITYFFKLK